MLSLVPVAGIDFGKHFLDLGSHPAAKPLRCDNTPAGRERLIAALRQRGVRRVALEAIGPYAHPVTVALAEVGFSVALVDPRRAWAFRTAEGQIAKTDRLDAALIARFAQRMPEHLHPAPAQVRLKALSTRRRQITELIAMEKTRLAQALDPPHGQLSVTGNRIRHDGIRAHLSRLLHVHEQFQCCYPHY